MGKHHKQEFKTGIGAPGKKLRRIAPVDHDNWPEKPDNWTPAPRISVEIDDRKRDTCKPTQDTQPPFAKVAKGPYLDETRFFHDSRPPMASKPISKAATKLLADYHRRRAFQRAVDDRAPVEWAAKELLGCGKTRAYEIQKEMPYGAYRWFVGEFIRELGARKIGEGRATARSDLADNFYFELSGGHLQWEELRMTGAGRHKIMLKEELSDKDIVTREVTSYGIISRAFYHLKEA